MNASNSSSKSAVRFTVDFVNKRIIGTKASFDKAGKGFGPEYEELTAKIAAHPDYVLTIKEPKNKSTKAKRTYEGMNDKFIRDYISTLDDANTRKEQYNSIQKMAADCDTKAFPMTKKWFLKEFGSEENGFDMVAAKERIAEFRISQAKKMAEQESQKASDTHTGSQSSVFSRVASAVAEAQTEVAA